MTTTMENTDFSPHTLEAQKMEEFVDTILFGDSMDELPKFGDTILGPEDASIGILLVHGFSGSNLEMLYLANYLALRGVRVAVPLLPGHGTSYHDLLNYGYEAWMNKVRKTHDYLLAEQDDRKIVGVGHSMGGSLLFSLAPDLNLEGLVSLAGPIRYPLYLRMLGKVVERTNLKIPFNNLKFYDKRLHDHPVVGFMQDKYEKIPLETLGEILEVINIAHDNLPSITLPICLIYARDDAVVPPYHVDHVVEEIGSNDLEISWLYRSNHIMVIDEDRDLVTKKVWTFINRVLDLIE